MLAQSLIKRLTFFEEWRQFFGERLGLWTILSEAGRGVDILVPVFRPDSVFGLGSGGPMEHRVFERYLESFARLSENAGWV